VENSVWNGLRNVRQSRGLSNDAKAQIVALKDETTQCIALDALLKFPDLSIGDACTVAPSLAATGRSVDEVIAAWAEQPAPKSEVAGLITVLEAQAKAESDAENEADVSA
jgi:hypothetical protein